MNRQRLLIPLANAFGLGNARYASGTVGSLLGIPLVLAISTLNGCLWAQIAICAILTIAAIPICDFAEKFYGIKDDGRIVADEYLLLPIGFINRGNLWEALTSGNAPLIREAILCLVIGFAIARIVDILKPSPARQIQNLPGGWGVVLDDFVASLYTWVLLWGVSTWFQYL